MIALVLVFRQSKTVLLINSLFKCHGLWSWAQGLSLLRRLQIKLNEVKLDQIKPSYLGSLNRAAVNNISYFVREQPDGFNARCDTGPIIHYN